MTSLDFEEFLWANGLDEKNIDILKQYTIQKKEIPQALVDYYKEMIKRYVVVGGMPESIKLFLRTNNYIKSREYLEGLINCNISLNGYTKEFINSLRKLANMVYPLIANTQTYNKTKYNNVKYNKYANNNSNATFSNNMNSTLDKMKRNY